MPSTTSWTSSRTPAGQEHAESAREQSVVAAENFVEIKRQQDPVLRLLGIEVRTTMLAAMATVFGGSFVKWLVDRNRIGA
jgi:hypothetical protein